MSLSVEFSKKSVSPISIDIPVDTEFNERIRNDNEVLRIANEKLRVNAEGLRLKCEDDRCLAEKARDSNEQVRVGSELDRVSSELIRVEAECKREKAERERELAFSKVYDVVTGINSIQVMDCSYNPFKEVVVDGVCFQSSLPTIDCPQDIATIKDELVLRTNDGVDSNCDVRVVNLQGNELCSLGDVTDKLVLRNGKVFIDKRIGKIVLNGSENWKFSWQNPAVSGSKSFALEKSFFGDMLPRFLSSGTNSISNLFSSIRGTVFHLNTNSCAINVDDSLCIQIRLTKDLLNYSESNSDAEICELMKSWLSNNNLVIFYELDSPRVIDLGLIDMPMGFDGLTNCFVETGLDTSFEVSYYNRFKGQKGDCGTSVELIFASSKEEAIDLSIQYPNNVYYYI